MIYVEAPAVYRPPISLFLGGGITGCPNWSGEFVKRIKDAELDLVVLNPRRENFPINDPKAAEEQIRWEQQYLKLADAILFWFCAETIQPIVLFELGRWLTHYSQKTLIVGVHPDYARRQDVLIQSHLLRPDVDVVDNLDRLFDKVQAWVRSRS